MSGRVVDVRVPGGRLRTEVRGAGPPVLLLHGISAHRGVWAAVVRSLQGRFRVLMPDLLGRGTSDAAPDARFGLGEELARLRALLDGLRAGSALPEGPPGLVVGHSQGAALALALARERPEVRGLVLASPVTPWTRRPRVLGVLRGRLIRRVAAGILGPLRRPLARGVLRRVYGPGTPVTEEAVERYAGPYAEPARAETLLRALADWRPGELEGHLPGRPLEARVLLGEEDPRIRAADAARLARRLGTRLERLPGVGHAVPEEAPERVCRAVLDVHAAVTAGGVSGR